MDHLNARVFYDEKEKHFNVTKNLELDERISNSRLIRTACGLYFVMDIYHRGGMKTVLMSKSEAARTMLMNGFDPDNPNFIEDLKEEAWKALK
jgi:hypothetical protein